MSKMNIPLFSIYWDEDDIEEVKESIKRGGYWATGPKINEFEDYLADYVGTEYAVAFNSGTSALHGSMLAHNIGEGDEVIVPSFSFIATANAPLFVGAKPVFAEIEDETYGLNPEDVKEKINKDTEAIVPVHYGGHPCLIEDLKEIAEDYNLALIEDAAESLGSEYKGDKVGTFGDSAMFSFCQSKVVTSGEGGAIVTDDKDIMERLKLARSHGRADDEDYFSTSEFMSYITLGYNFRMADMVAALGLSQLRKIEDLIEMRRSNARYLTEKFSDMGNINHPQSLNSCQHVYQMYTVEVEEERNELKDYLTENNIGTKVYFRPIHLTEFYRDKFDYRKGDLPFTESISEKVLTLPMFPDLEEEEMDYIVENVREFLSKH